MQCSNNETLTFDIKTKEIFFQGEIENSSKDLVEFYEKTKYLSLDPPPQGYTIYPPLSALSGDGRTDKHYTFRFTIHPYLPIDFREGELIISSRESNNRRVYSEPSLKFYFDTKEQLEEAYKKLVDIYTPLSTRKRFSNYKNTKTAEFTDDNSKSIKEVGFLKGDWDIVTKAYVLVFALGNDIDIDKED